MSIIVLPKTVMMHVCVPTHTRTTRKNLRKEETDVNRGILFNTSSNVHYNSIYSHKVIQNSDVTLRRYYHKDFFDIVLYSITCIPVRNSRLYKAHVSILTTLWHYCLLFPGPNLFISLQLSRKVGWWMSTSGPHHPEPSFPSQPLHPLHLLALTSSSICYLNCFLYIFLAILQLNFPSNIKITR